MRTLQRETVVVTGCSTDWCVEATAWDGNGLDYYLVMVSDSDSVIIREAPRDSPGGATGTRPRCGSSGRSAWT